MIPFRMWIEIWTVKKWKKQNLRSISTLFLLALICACSRTPTIKDNPKDIEDKVAKKNTIRFESGRFDPEKPTIVFFGGGNCVNSWDGTESWDNAETNGETWFEKTNVISLRSYVKDKETTDEAPTYFEVSKLVVDTLLSLSKNYDKKVQACGFSTGGSPALDLALYTAQEEERLSFQISNVTLMDSPCYDYNDRLKALTAQSEPPLIVNLIGGLFTEFDRKPYPGVLNAQIIDAHDEVFWWYVNSLTSESSGSYNEGITAGSALSIIGEASDLRIPNSEKVEFYFNWEGNTTEGIYSLFDAENYPKKLEW